MLLSTDVVNKTHHCAVEVMAHADKSMQIQTASDY